MNKQLRVCFFNKSKIGFLNRKQSKMDSLVHLTHHDPRDLGLIFYVKEKKNPSPKKSVLKLDSSGFKDVCAKIV